MHTPPPSFTSYEQCFASLRDTEFWEPYVHAVLARHGLPIAPIEAGFVGRFPTYLVGDVVVKLFGAYRTWRADSETELAVQQRLSDLSAVPAPRLLAFGRLYDGKDPWPYLVTERMAGTPWREATLSSRQRLQIAGQLGKVARTVHAVTVPDAPIFQTSRLSDRTVDGAAWHRQVMPGHLAAQIDSYVIREWPEQRLVHADLTQDHIFITDRGGLSGVIDWGDAQATDPHYELAPLHVLTFGCDKALLRAFLAGYGWNRAPDFQHRAMSATLLHRKSNLFTAIDAIHSLQMFSTLEELAVYLWDIDE
jgi:aminoglycoside phosphotransferase (APT) family kinase protein